jgi:CRISPR type III-B/RAMP module RAMP protein Cmr6
MSVTATDIVATALGGERFPHCESPSLRLEKFVRIGGNTKAEEVNAVVSVQRRHAKDPAHWAPAGAITLNAKLGGRLIINQAGGVLENAGLCLHRHFGYPYIPGSAVKGIARHAAWCEWQEAEEPQKRAIAAMIVKVFGYPTNDKGLDAFIEPDKKKRKATVGNIAFMAAVPQGKAELVVDIVNCHHMKYYGGEKDTATDDESANPQFFPVVESGSEWRFSLVPLRGVDNSVLGLAKEWLIKGIVINGAGAKTAAGYGWFVYDADAEAKRLEEEKEMRNREELGKEFEAWFNSNVVTLDSVTAEELAKQISAVERERDKFKERYLAMKTVLPKEQQVVDAINTNRKRLPKLTPEDEVRQKWSNMSIKSVINSELKQFERQTDVVKALWVTVLRDGEGIGKEVWTELKKLAQKKGKNPLTLVEQGIRKFNNNVLKLEKMP